MSVFSQIHVGPEGGIPWMTKSLSEVERTIYVRNMRNGDEEEEKRIKKLELELL